MKRVGGDKGSPESKFEPITWDEVLEIVARKFVALRDAGKQLNGIRLIQMHPKVAAAAGVKDGDAVVVESPRGGVTGTALVWKGIREDTIFVPNTFGPIQKMAEEFGDPLYEPANTLLDDRYYDNLSGQQAYKCFACRVKKA